MTMTARGGLSAAKLPRSLVELGHEGERVLRRREGVEIVRSDGGLGGSAGRARQDRGRRRCGEAAIWSGGVGKWKLRAVSSGFGGPDPRWQAWSGVRASGGMRVGCRASSCALADRGQREGMVRRASASLRQFGAVGKGREAGRRGASERRGPASIGLEEGRPKADEGWERRG
ncbi:uncharacterized protein A4U43_C07F21530 [Asparagus officinalis]|uniref:Uncharacterized protein n=1 Tax=Asparagus officinalis TaxID=4686 RepID=A0A5P1EDS3_ASPOF|nr:uncharacterized protein A4U43_C07F21530 [Asparagus officinalis]